MYHEGQHRHAAIFDLIRQRESGAGPEQNTPKPKPAYTYISKSDAKLLKGIAMASFRKQQLPGIQGLRD
ncbi:MAG: hypothetical protein AB3N22_18295 [Ruegeria sp.]